MMKKNHEYTNTTRECKNHYKIQNTKDIIENFGEEIWHTDSANITKQINLKKGLLYSHV